MAPSTSAPEHPPRSMRALVPFFVPGSLDRNASLEPPTTAAAAVAAAPPATVAVRKWDRATGVFKDPVPVTVSDRPSARVTAPARMHRPSPADAPTPSVTLLTPAAIRASSRANAPAPATAPAPEAKVPVPTCTRTVPSSTDEKQDRPVAPSAPSTTTPPVSVTTTPTPTQVQAQVQVDDSKRERSPAATPSGTPGRREVVTTPVRKPPKRRAVSCSPNAGGAMDVSSQGGNITFKYAGSSFEAASPAPISIPIPRLAERSRRHSHSDTTGRLAMPAMLSLPNCDR